MSSSFVIREHWEDNPLDRGYPVKMFFNGIDASRTGQTIMGLHWHEHFEIIIMREGRGVFHIDSRPYEAAPGDVLIVQAGDLHVGYSLSGGEIRYVSIVFNAALFSETAQDPAFERYVQPFMEGRVRMPAAAAAGASGGAVREPIGRAIAEYASSGPANRLLVKTYLLLAMTHLAREHLPQALADKPKSSIHRQTGFKELIRYVESHIGEPMSVEEAARRVSLNPFHFCKMFKRMTGRTFVDFVNLCRMKEANRLLIETGASVTEVAERVGCGNPNYFTKLFKQYMGMTPSQARKG